MSAFGFVILVYSGAVAYGGFWLGSKYKTVANMKDQACAWLAARASRK